MHYPVSRCENLPSVIDRLIAIPIRIHPLSLPHRPPSCQSLGLFVLESFCPAIIGPLGRTVLGTANTTPAAVQNVGLDHLPLRT